MQEAGGFHAAILQQFGEGVVGGGTAISVGECGAAILAQIG